MQRGNWWTRHTWGAWPRRSWGTWRGQTWGAWPRCYSTPEPLGQWMVKLANIRPGMRILEPSAGDGAIADVIRAACPDAWLDVLELDPALQGVLQQKGHRLVGNDVFAYQPGPIYNAVVMNPPFTGRLDIWHILSCFDLLAPGGRLVTIASEESTNGPSTRAEAFRVWLREMQAWVHLLPGGPQGVFMQSSRPTQVATCLIVVQRPAAS